MSSITTLTSTRALLKPEISQTGWQCSPFSMMYVSCAHFCSLFSKFRFFSDHQVVQHPHRMPALFTRNDQQFCWRKFTKKVIWEISRCPLKWMILCFSVLLLGSKAPLTAHLHAVLLNECLFPEECSGFQAVGSSRLGEVNTAATPLLASTVTAAQSGCELVLLGQSCLVTNDSLTV